MGKGVNDVNSGRLLSKMAQTHKCPVNNIVCIGLSACVVATELDSRPDGGSGGPSTLLWSCSFEPAADQLCGITQERSRDQFDWSVHSGRTPSDPTGPDHAHHGSYYAYIEASDPRRANDEAWSAFRPLSLVFIVTVLLDFM